MSSKELTFQGLQEVLNAGEPEQGRNVVDLTPEQATLLKAQFLPYMHEALLVFEQWGHKPYDANAQLLDEHFGDPSQTTVISGQFGEDVAIVREQNGRSVRKITLLNGDGEFLVTWSNTDEISHRGFNVKIHVPLDNGNVTAVYHK